MKRYVFMLLDSGVVKSKDSTKAAKYQELQLAHLNKLAEDEKLIVVGPFEGGRDHRG